MSKTTAVGAEVTMASGEMALAPADARAGSAPDASLVERCRRGDAEAFARLVSLHESMVYNLSVRLLGDGEEAKDVSQEVFLQVYRTLARFEGRSSLKTWIYRIVVNHCRNRQRWWRRRFRDRARAIEDLTPKDEASLQTAPDDSPFEQVARRERARRVQRALLGLSFDHRAILLLREVEGLSCEQISAALAVPEGTVKSRLARARESLRRGLEGECA